MHFLSIDVNWVESSLEHLASMLLFKHIIIFNVWLRDRSGAGIRGEESGWRLIMTGRGEAGASYDGAERAGER